MCLRPDPKRSSSPSQKSSVSTNEGDQKQSTSFNKQLNIIKSTHSDHKRNTQYDVILFFLPLLFTPFTPTLPIILIGATRIFMTKLTLTLHYLFFDKDNYFNKLTQKQLEREKDDYLTGTILHMYTQIPLQIIFPQMFFSDTSNIPSCAWQTFVSHVLLVEPLYYFVHRWLHIPEQMKKMHGFHHLSISTLPSTSLVQNFDEHFVYVMTFGPAFFFPFFYGGCQHWTIIGAYLVLFDLINAYGHMNIKLRSPIWTSRWSPLRYLFYTPEFHLGHHKYFSANYGLFMPLYDFLLGTHRHYQKPDLKLAPKNQQDFVFIGHNGGLGHFLTCPEVSVYNVYDSYKRTFLPIELEFFVMHLICCVSKLFLKCYTCSRYLVGGKYIGRIICIMRTPYDYMSPSKYESMNREIVDLIKAQYQKCQTRCFGLGNLNKMKQLNDGGAVIAEMVKSDEYLKDKNIRVWTGDTMTAASVYNQIADIPNLEDLFYVGANGKIGNAVCQLLLKNKPNLKICIYSRYHGIDHPNITYTYDLRDMLKYKVVMVGKMLSGKHYANAFGRQCGSEFKKNGIPNDHKTRFILDYTVPFIPIDMGGRDNIKHIQVGLLETKDATFLQGHFDICMSHDENHIYPCHAGCILNMLDKRETDETGDVDPNEMDRMWKRGLALGLKNKKIHYG